MKVFENHTVEEVIQTRRSVRVYTKENFSEEMLEKIKNEMLQTKNPFNVAVNFTLLEVNQQKNTTSLGTYGVIKGASTYIGVTAEKHPLALEAVGYAMERLILSLTDLGIGTCWIGGTFKKEAFSKAMEIKAHEFFPAITPIGYAENKNSFSNRMVRFIAKSDQRKPWEEIFFNQSFDKPLSKEEAGQYALALELVRIAPSASNKQPWRIVKEGKTFHFYEEQTPGYTKAFQYDIQQLDVGIAAAHFQLCLLEANIAGEFKVIEDRALSQLRENTFYRFSWIEQ